MGRVPPPGEARKPPAPARHVSHGARRAGGGRKAAKDGRAARQKISTASVPLITGRGKKRPLCARDRFWPIVRGGPNGRLARVFLYGVFLY